MFAGLSALVIEGLDDDAGVIVVRASTRDGPVACPGCGVSTGRVHGYFQRQVADVAVGGRRVLLRVRVRRMRCPVLGCARQTFHEQLPGVMERYQRRTARLNAQVGTIVRELAGRAGAKVPAALGVAMSRQTALRSLLKLPLGPRPVPRVIGVDDFALRKRHRYATVIINAETRERIDVLADRKTETLQAWLREHPGVQVVCRDSSGAYRQAINRLPEAVQVADRWHLWHNLAQAALKEVAAHSCCWGKTGPPPRETKRAATTRERWRQVHDLLDKGVGLLEVARRLNLALNTVKRYARTLVAHVDGAGLGPVFGVGEHQQHRLAFAVQLGVDQAEAGDHPVGCADQHELAAPVEAVVGGVVAVSGPSGQVRAFGGFPGRSATDRGAVHEPDGVGGGRAGRGQPPQRVFHQVGRCAQPQVVGGLRQQPREQVTDAVGGGAQPVPLVVVAQQHLRDGQAHQLGIGDQRRPPRTTVQLPRRNDPIGQLDIECDEKGVQIGDHEDLHWSDASTAEAVGAANLNTPTLDTFHMALAHFRW